MNSRMVGAAIAAVSLLALLAPSAAGPAQAAPRTALVEDPPGWVDPRTVSPVAVPEGQPAPWAPEGAPRPPGPDPVPTERPGPEGLTGGTLDPSFSGDGLATPNFVPGYEDASGVLVQPDGKIVVAGEANGRFQLARFNANGSPDGTFGGDGAVQTDISPGLDWAYDVALQADGRLVAAGVAGGVSVVARYHANGTLDTSYGQQGFRGLAVGRGFNFASSVEVDGAGRAVFAGRAGGSGGRVVVARLTTAGDPDIAFSGDGFTPVDFTGGDDWAWDVAVRPDDGVVAVGAAEGRRFSMAVARLTAGGALDTTFHQDGRRLLSLDVGEEIATGVALQDDGGTVVAGYHSGEGGRMAVARLDEAGLYDPGFDGDGWATVNFTGGEDFAWSVVVQEDGAVVLAGRSTGRGGRLALARLVPGGTLDPDFGGDGRVTRDLSAGFDVALDLAVDADGRIVVAGARDAGAAQAALVVARYLAA